MAVLVEQPLAQIDGAPLYQVIVVEASYENRIERLQMRGLTKEDADARMQSQATDKERRLVADLIICNDNSFRTCNSKHLHVGKCSATGSMNEKPILHWHEDSIHKTD